MTLPQTTLIAAAVVLMLAGTVANFAAMIVYARQPGASMFGFGYARYFYGEMRRSRPSLFGVALFGPLLGLAAMLTAGFFKAS